jgi:hypothetical protein
MWTAEQWHTCCRSTERLHARPPSLLGREGGLVCANKRSKCCQGILVCQILRLGMTSSQRKRGYPQLSHARLGSPVPVRVSLRCRMEPRRSRSPQSTHQRRCGGSPEPRTVRNLGRVWLAFRKSGSQSSSTGKAVKIVVHSRFFSHCNAHQERSLLHRHLQKLRQFNRRQPQAGSFEASRRRTHVQPQLYAELVYERAISPNNKAKAAQTSARGRQRRITLNGRRSPENPCSRRPSFYPEGG